jgi:hypothetical protein
MEIRYWDIKYKKFLDKQIGYIDDDCFMLHGLPHNTENDEKLIIYSFIGSMKVKGNKFEKPELLS